jgi:hypothetical protein
MTITSVRLDYLETDRDRSIRHDAGELARPIKRLGRGTLFTGRAARVGVMRYPWGIERRDADELDNVISQLTGKPVLINHPPLPGLLSQGATGNVVGVVERAWRQDDHAVVEMFINDPLAVPKIRSDYDQLSLGYALAEARPKGGLHRGTRVDHLALVPSSRCGPSCSVRLDCSCGCQVVTSTSERRAALAVNILRARRR